MDRGSNKYTCPHICPGREVVEEKHHEVTGTMKATNSMGEPYVPGRIKPPEIKHYPPDAPPRYLPQPTDSTSGDFLIMGPTGPWAAGHVDWTPHAGMTGVRPVVDKYSITRYSTGEWRKNNLRTLTPVATDRGREAEAQGRKQLADAFAALDNKRNDTNNNFDKRIKDLAHWQNAVRKTLDAITDEINKLDADRTRLKSASRILQIPEAISRECLELRTSRYEPDLVRDDAEQELITEVSIVGEIRRVFNETLMKAERQMEMNRAAKAAIELDWTDKLIALAEDKRNVSLAPDSTLIMHHPGVMRWPENATTLEYWEHYCSESIKNCEEVRKKSKDLRSALMTNIIKGSQDMKTQADRTNAALGETIATTESLLDKLEDTLKDNLKQIADIENYIDHLNDRLRHLNDCDKLGMTRLQSRNYGRPNVENCRDDAQYALMDEGKFVKETIDSFANKLREAESVRADLMKYRGALEKDIACKRKSLNVDKDRCARVRAFMPTPEEFASA